MRHVNAAGSDQEGLSPSAAEGRYVRGESDDRRGQSIEFRQLHRRRVQDFASFGAARSRSGNSCANICGIAHRAKHDFCFRVIGNNIGSTAAADRSDIQRAAPEQRIFRQWNLANIAEDIEKSVNRGMTEFRIRGMRELSLRGNFVAQRALATESEAVLGGLSIDEKSRAARIRGGGLCSGAVAFLADNK